MRSGTFSALVYEALEDGPATIKELTEKCSMTYQRVSNCIFNLRDFGRIERIAHGTYQIKNTRRNSKMATITRKTESPIAWGEIKEAVKAGKAAEILHVGDEITETLTTGEQVVFVVAGIGVYAENQVIFSLKNCLAEEYHMNEDWTNKGGWPACDMRRHLTEDVFHVLPDDLKAVITPRKLTTDDGEAEDNIWLFSEYEVFGEDWCDKDPGDKPIPYYQTPANRVKCDADGDTTWWWERSPYVANSNGFCNVYSNGGANNYNASHSYGVCFGFCI